MIGVVLWRRQRAPVPRISAASHFGCVNLVSLAAECECRVTLALTNSEKTFLGGRDRCLGHGAMRQNCVALSSKSSGLVRTGLHPTAASLVRSKAGTGPGSQLHPPCCDIPRRRRC